MAKQPLSDTEDRTVFDSVELFGPIIITRNIDDRSLHLFLSDANDQLAFMTSPKPEPAIYKMPECD